MGRKDNILFKQYNSTEKHQEKQSNQKIKNQEKFENITGTLSKKLPLANYWLLLKPLWHWTQLLSILMQ